MKSLRDHANDLRRKGVVKPTPRTMLAQGDEVHNHITGFTGLQMLSVMLIALIVGAVSMLLLATPNLRVQHLINEAGPMTEIELINRLALPANVASAIGEILKTETPTKSSIDYWFYLSKSNKAPSISLDRATYLTSFISAYLKENSGSVTFDEILDVAWLMKNEDAASIVKSLQLIKPEDRSRIAKSLVLASNEAELMFRMADAIAKGTYTALINWARHILINQSPISQRMAAQLHYLWAYQDEEIKCTF